MILSTCKAECGSKATVGAKSFGRAKLARDVIRTRSVLIASRKSSISCTDGRREASSEPLRQACVRGSKIRDFRHHETAKPFRTTSLTQTTSSHLLLSVARGFLGSLAVQSLIHRTTTTNPTAPPKPSDAHSVRAPRPSSTRRASLSRAGGREAPADARTAPQPPVAIPRATAGACYSRHTPFAGDYGPRSPYGTHRNKSCA